MVTAPHQQSPVSSTATETQVPLPQSEPRQVLEEGDKPPDPSKAEGEDLANLVDQAPPGNRPPDPSKAEGEPIPSAD
jgi:hypothetical protein